MLLIGNTSSGKTSILNAIIRKYFELSETDTFPRSNILFVNNLKEQGIQYFRGEMKTFCQSKSTIFGKKKLLIIDDIDKIISDHKTEEILFTLIDNQILHKKSVVITSTDNIETCGIGLSDLLSRLLSDKIFHIKDLDDENKIKLLMSYCSERGLVVSEKVFNYIINNCSRDLFFLCAFIRTLDNASLSMKKRVTIPFIKKAISKLAS